MLRGKVNKVSFEEVEQLKKKKQMRITMKF